MLFSYRFEAIQKRWSVWKIQMLKIPNFIRVIRYFLWSFFTNSLPDRIKIKFELWKSTAGKKKCWSIGSIKLTIRQLRKRCLCYVQLMFFRHFHQNHFSRCSNNKWCYIRKSYFSHIAVKFVPKCPTTYILAIENQPSRVINITSHKY